MINARSLHRNHDNDDIEKTQNSPSPVEKRDNKDSAKVDEVQSVSDNQDERDVGITDERDLDQVGLKSAFRFAAWSSIALVSPTKSACHLSVSTRDRHFSSSGSRELHRVPLSRAASLYPFL